MRCSTWTFPRPKWSAVSRDGGCAGGTDSTSFTSTTARLQWWGSAMSAAESCTSAMTTARQLFGHDLRSTAARETAPVIDHYRVQGLVSTISALGQVQEVLDRALAAIDQSG